MTQKIIKIHQIFVKLLKTTIRKNNKILYKHLKTPEK